MSSCGDGWNVFMVVSRHVHHGKEAPEESR